MRSHLTQLAHLTRAGLFCIIYIINYMTTRPTHFAGIPGAVYVRLIQLTRLTLSILCNGPLHLPFTILDSKLT